MVLLIKKLIITFIWLITGLITSETLSWYPRIKIKSKLQSALKVINWGLFVVCVGFLSKIIWIATWTIK